MLKMSKLEEKLDMMFKALTSIALIELTTIMGAKGAEWVYKMAEKGDTNGAIFGATYTAGLCLLSLAYPISHLCDKYKEYKANKANQTF